MQYVIDMVRRDSDGRVARVHWHTVDNGGHVRTSAECDAIEVVAKLRGGARVNIVIGGEITNGLCVTADGLSIVDGPDARVGSRLGDMPEF